LKARIIYSSKRDFECRIEDTKEVVTATALGNLLKGSQIVVGDYVELQKQDNDEFIIQSVQERKNEVFRRLVREKKKKMTAANVDVLVIVMSASRPEYKRGLVDRYLLRAMEWEIPALLVFNKMDEFDESFELEFETKRLEKIGVTAFETCAKDASLKAQFLSNGYDELKSTLEGKTAIFLGQSGVGKSKLISLLNDGKFELLSNQLAKVGKGAHTTTWAQLIDCETFELIDSPGVRSMSIEDISIDDLNRFYPDIFPIMQKCKFVDCLHEENSKGCAFHELDSENYEDALILSRLDSYLRHRDEITSIPEWKK
jgi:ribosome biogenesis GTPase